MKQMLLLSAVLLACFTTGSMGAVTPVNGTATVDGLYAEWDTSIAGADFATHMYEAGKPDKDILSNLYMRYDCQNRTLYSLVLLEDDYTAVNDPESAWLKIYDIQNNPLVDGNSGDDGTPPDFAWVMDSSDYIGYEAAIVLDPGSFPHTYNNTGFEVHINIATPTGGEGRTSSTGRDPHQSLTLECTPTVPAPGAFLLAGIGSGLVGYMRRRKSL